MEETPDWNSRPKAGLYHQATSGESQKSFFTYLNYLCCSFSPFAPNTQDIWVNKNTTGPVRQKEIQRNNS